jgi:hypothetical protein
MKAEGPKTGTELNCQPPKVDIGRIDVRLCGPNGAVVLVREGQLAKLREESVEAIKWNRLRRGDFDAPRSA